MSLVYNLIDKYFKGKVDKGGEIYVHHLYTVANKAKWLAQSYGFSDNKIFTIPFTFRGYISFVGKKISEAPLNICMIFVCLYYLIAFLADMDNFGHLDLFFSISFHLFILVIEIFLSTIDYISIYI